VLSKDCGNYFPKTSCVNHELHIALPATIVFNWGNESAFPGWEKIKVGFAINTKKKGIKNLPGRVILL
jgi:hypothetical protein